MINQFLASIEHGWGLALILYFQSLREQFPLLTYLAFVFHFIGSEAFIMPMVFAVYWSISKEAGRRLLPVFLFSSWLNIAVKNALRRPRPFNVSNQVHTPDIARDKGYGIPSGHTQNSTFAGGVIAKELGRWWIMTAAVAYAVLTGLSRMFLGAHFPQDVIVGLLLGLVALTVYGALEPRIGRWLHTQSMITQMGAVAAASAVMMLINPGLIRPSSPVWLTTPLEPDNLLVNAMIPIAGFLGVGIGLVLEANTLDFDSSGSWSQRVFRFIIGMVGVAALYLALAPLSFVPVVPFLGDLIRFGLVGLWIAYGAPWVFVRLNLASARRRIPDPYAKE